MFGVFLAEGWLWDYAEGFSAEGWITVRVVQKADYKNCAEGWVGKICAEGWFVWVLCWGLTAVKICADGWMEKVCTEGWFVRVFCWRLTIISIVLTACFFDARYKTYKTFLLVFAEGLYFCFWTKYVVNVCL